MNKSKKPTENLLLNGILIKISITANRQNKSSDKFPKLMKYSLIKKREKTTIGMDIKGQNLNVLQDLQDIILTSMMLKIFSGTFLNKTHLKMTFSVNSSEEIRPKKTLLQKKEVEVLVHLTMILFFQEDLVVDLKVSVWDFLELTLYLMMMTFFQVERRTFQ